MSASKNQFSLTGAESMKGLRGKKGTPFGYPGESK
jgi:hypothetical protein